ncbi:MAG: hypothetical protein AAGB12_11870 [Pseudomonadota bacterium]
MQLSSTLQTMLVSSLLLMSLAGCSDDDDTNPLEVNAETENTDAGAESQTSDDGSDEETSDEETSDEEESSDEDNEAIEPIGGDEDDGGDDGDGGSSEPSEPADTTGALLKDITFADAAIKTCIEESIAPENLDTITVTEITIIACDDPAITQFEEVELFTNIETLWLVNTKVPSLTLDNHPKLRRLNIFTDADQGTGELSELDLSGTPALEITNLFRNKLTEIDFTANPALQYAHVALNQLTDIDLSQNGNLLQFTGFDNAFSRLDLSELTELINLEISNNNLTAVDLSLNTKLRRLEIANNDLIQLDLSNNPEIERITASDNPIVDIVFPLNRDELIAVAIENADLSDDSIALLDELAADGVAVAR